MSETSVEKRVANLERTIARIEEWLRSATELKNSKPALAMVEAGKVAEAICEWVLAENVPDSPVDRRSLSKKAQPFLPLDINNHILAVQSYRNSGAHSQGPAYETTAGEVETCFVALAHVTRWFLERYKPGAVPPVVVSEIGSSAVIVLRIGYDPETVVSTASELGVAAVEQWLDTRAAPRFKLESGEVAAWNKLLAGHAADGEKTDEAKSRERIAAKTRCKEIAELFKSFQAASDLFFGQEQLAYVRDPRRPDDVGAFLAGLANKTMLRMRDDPRRHYDVYTRNHLGFRIRVAEEEQSRMLEAFCVPTARMTSVGFSCLLGDVPSDIMLHEVLPAWMLRYLRCQETLEWKRKNEGYTGPDGLDSFFDVSAWFVGSA